MKRIVCLLAMCLMAPEGAQSKPLSGHVKKEQVRISRPGIQLDAATAATTLTPKVQSTDFAIGTTKLEAPAPPEMKPMEPLQAKPMLPANAGETNLSSGAATAASTTGGGGSGGAPANYDYGAKPKVDYKTIVIRLKRYRALQEMEVCWEASRMANRMLKKGAPVIVLLDWEAVHAADMNDTAFAWNEKNRGNGNESAERLTVPQDHLRQFVASGGRLVVSARWIKLFAISHRAIVPGAQMATEDEIDDILMDPNTQLIDY